MFKMFKMFQMEMRRQDVQRSKLTPMSCKTTFCVSLELTTISRGGFRKTNEKLLKCTYIFRSSSIRVLGTFKIFCNHYLKTVNAVPSMTGHFVSPDTSKWNTADLLKSISWRMKQTREIFAISKCSL